MPMFMPMPPMGPIEQEVNVVLDTDGVTQRAQTIELIKTFTIQIFQLLLLNVVIFV